MQIERVHPTAILNTRIRFARTITRATTTKLFHKKFYINMFTSENKFWKKIMLTLQIKRGEKVLLQLVSLGIGLYAF